MSDGSIGSPVEARRGTVSAPSFERLAGWTFPLVFVLLFVLVAFVPGITSGTATVNIADLAVLAVTVAALVRLHREGVEALRASLWLWGTSLALLAYIALASLYPAFSDPDYAWKTHFATAVKFAEFFVLAPAAAVLLRDRRSLRRFYAVVVVFTLVAAGGAILQFVGVHMLRDWGAGNREPSFTGIANLGTVGAATLALGFLGELWPESVSRRTTIGALIGGVIAVILSGQAAAGLGVGAAMIASLLLVRARRRLEARRVMIVVGMTTVCALGLIGLRGGDITQFGRSIGIIKADRATSANVQTYAQRTLMYYIGLRIWEAHPVFGAGWQSVREPHVYEPFLAAAHRRFPGQPAEAFPSAKNRWGVDNAYLQSLAELGVVGTLFLLVFLGTALLLGVRGSLRAPPAQAQLALAGLLWMLVTMGIWAGQGLVAGAGFAALPFFALGLIAAGRVPQGTSDGATR